MRFILVVWVGLVLAGCAEIRSQAMETARTQNSARTGGVRIGMTKQEVLNVMGTEPVIIPGIHQAKINNPYRTTAFKGTNGKIYEIIYYYTDYKKQDGVITDDELTPFIIEDGSLIGWGWETLDSISKIEVRVR